MWSLVLILVTVTDVTATSSGYYESMTSCFEAREEVLLQYRGYDGNFPAGIQAVCITLPAKND